VPDRWRFSFDEADTGNERGFHRADFKDDAWPLVATFNTTLDAQGYDKNAVLWYRTKITVPEKQKNLALFFGEVDGKAEVFVNGEKIAVPEKFQGAKKPGATITPGTKPAREGLAKPRSPFEVDVSAAIKPGENTIAVRVDHSQITDLSLGGILRPVLLVAKPE
jgi:beta-galactosidase/beta-glucuronidase